jgi:restriction system-associated AAA family ATPase
MKLLRVHVIAADTCGGLLNGLDLWMRSPSTEYSDFSPICLIGPNGSGKSQFLQVLAEVFQCIFHRCVPGEERVFSDRRLQFEIEYLIQPRRDDPAVHVRIARKPGGKSNPDVVIQMKEAGSWIDCPVNAPETIELLPQRVVGYTSGDNETLSLPFLVSRSGYADEVARCALNDSDNKCDIPDTRLMLIDYGTHLEVLVANLLLGTQDQHTALLHEARLKDLHSFRCVIQLAHSAAPKAPARRSARSKRKGIQLTDELESYIANLQRCATCYDYDRKTETYTFDFLVDDQCREAFRHFWHETLKLYSSLHKLSMLNDLAIPKPTRERLKRDAATGHFASRLPEPQDEEKVFRFEQVNFIPNDGEEAVDYVALSDGEHQLAQIFGTFCMVSYPNVLFVLDEPESHFNPQWRVKFISSILELSTNNGIRKDGSAVSQQDCILTTHAPFVPSDMPRERILIFGKDAETGRVSVRLPEIETYGTTFDGILEECFGVHPPISAVPRQDINNLMQSNDPDEVKAGIERLGNSVEKVFLADRLRQLDAEGTA